MSKRRKGFPSETNVQRGDRVVHGDKELMEKLGPAANSGASMLLYGPPGNGKSTIAEAICATGKRAA